MPRSPGPELATERLLLRGWHDADVEPFAAMNADPEVMRYFPSPLTRDETATMIHRVELGFAERGFGFWAVEVPGVVPFIGFVGIQPLMIDVPFAGSVEVGWRLAREHWGRGYATEGARAALRFGFDELALTEIVAITSADNVRSRRVMERIGMTLDPTAAFEHPAFPSGHEHAPHVLYRIAADTHASSGSAGSA